MSIVTQHLPPEIARKLVAQPEFTAMCVSSWRYSAYAAGDLAVETYRAFNESSDPEERAYLGWEIITSIVELTEMTATAWLSRTTPGGFAVHRASNKEIETLWTQIAANGADAADARSFLRLRGLGGFGPAAIAGALALGRVLLHVERLLRDLATFWRDQAPNARWFRHFPATLTPDDAWRIDPAPDNADILRQMATVDDSIEFVTHMDDARSFHHTVLRQQDVRAAVALGDIAIQLVMNWLANSGLDPNEPADRRHLLPAIAIVLGPEERRILGYNAYAFD